MKKFLLIIFLFFFTFPAVQADDLEVVSYQKLKNVTKHDHPAGSELTMGFAGDEIRFLIFVQNRSDQTRTFTIRDQLPQYLIYQKDSTYRYKLGSGNGWQKVVNKKSEQGFPLQNYSIKVDPDTGYYFKFSTLVSTDLPPNNVTLSNFVKITDEADNLLKQSVTKVLVPNSTVSEVQSVLPEQSEEEYLNQVLEEEQAFIERTFFDLAERGFEAELPEKEPLIERKNDLTESVSNTPISSEGTSSRKVHWVLGVILAVAFILVLKIKK